MKKEANRIESSHDWDGAERKGEVFGFESLNPTHMPRERERERRFAVFTDRLKSLSHSEGPKLERLKIIIV